MKLRFCFLLIMAGSSISSAYEADEIADTFNLIAQGHANNLETLRTWQGSAVIIDDRRLADGTQISATSQVLFCAELQIPAIRFDLVQVQTSNDKLVEHFSIKCIVLPEKVYYLDDRFFPSQDQKQLIVYEPGDPMLRGRDYYDFFDPRFYFTCGGHRIPELFSGWAAMPKGELEKLRITDMTMKDNVLSVSKGINTFRFDLNKGWNLIHCDTRIGDVTEALQRVEFTQIGESFVPSSYEKFLRDIPTGELWLHRKVLFKESLVNAAIDPTILSEEDLGLNPDDIVWDRIVGTQYSVY